MSDPIFSNEIFHTGGVWTRERTAQAIRLIVEMGATDRAHLAPHYLMKIVEELRTPVWVTAICAKTRKWMEDDAHPPDAEGIREAAMRLFGLDIKDDKTVKRAETFDAGDAFYSLIVSDPVLVIVTSPMGGEIHVLDPEIINYWDAVRPAEIFLQEFLESR